MATELFAEQGFSDAMTQDLADRLGVGKGTIYRYFPSKRELFLAAADRVMRTLSAQVEANIAGIEDGLERIARGILAFLTFFAEHPEYVELLIQERAQFKDRTRPTYIEHRQVHGQQWRRLYGELTAEGRLRDISPQQISDVVGNLIYGTMFTNYFAGPAKPVAEQARDILDVVFRGILSERERARLRDADLLAGPGSAAVGVAAEGPAGGEAAGR
ncbi:TetR/AcrR family transcriptional regulator [Paludisphaera soli]|uniref:TetR/AcrR family transcriptional regulator n=1 Tax=Paludisphaera soli TaxID=2712865 RepID=UPI001F0E3225|nr:TetR/AcrR family transcriptional regulator [Paludisphaera soli]